MLRRSTIALGFAAVIAALPLVPASAGGGGCTEVTQGGGTTVELLRSCITPTLLRVEPGREVAFVNRDSIVHVITGAGYAWGSEGEMRLGESFAVTFDRPGVYPFQCYLHPGMTGAVIVGDASGKGAASKGGVAVESFAAPASKDTVVVSGETRTQPATSGPAMGRLIFGAAGLAAGLAVGLFLRRRPVSEVR